MNGLKENAREVASRLRERGFKVLYAGGCVRDMLRGLEPKDIDIATSATPDEVLQVFPKGNQVGAHFGVILVSNQGVPFEIATFREDGKYHDGRHPEGVCFSTPEKDAQRRDFTINGLFEDPWTGEVIDYVGGRIDLDNRIIRAIGDPVQRFSEDSLRLMRAVRFATVTEFEIEPATWSALCDHAGWLDRVSIERIREELVKILLSPHRGRGVDLLMDSGLMKLIIPELYATVGCEQPPNWHPEGDVYTHTRIMLDMLEGEVDITLVLAVLLHDIGKPPTFSREEDTDRIRFNSHDSVGAEMCQNILRRLKFPNTVIEEVTEMVKTHMQFMNVTKMRPARLRRFMSRPTFDRELVLHRLDCGSSNGLMDNYLFLKEKLNEFSSEPLMPPPLVTGNDIIERGIAPGPLFKTWLEDIQTEQLENRLKTREEALAFLDNMIKEQKNN